MFTNQKVLGVILIIFIIGVAVYFTVVKLREEVGNLSSSPSPSPTLEFLFNKSPAPQQQVQQEQELPLSKNKRLTQFPGILKPEVLKNKKGVIQTKKGLIQLEIYPEATMAASNFILLSANGFYDNLTFHRVETWVIQGGDPLGDGTGGPGYFEIERNLFGKYDRGIVAYAKRADEPHGAFGSQFFIMIKDQPLPLEYAIFGKVISGMEVVEKISAGDVMERVVIQDRR